MERKELCDKILFKLKKGKTITDLITELELNEYEIIGLIKIMKDEGYNVDYENGQAFIVKKGKTQSDEIKIPIKNDEFKFIAISDTHYASKWDNPRLVDYAYELAEKDNCQFVTHSGDIFDGDFHSKRPEHIYQVKKLGLEQLDYVVDNYPKSPLPTYFITGNHDFTFVKACGVDIGQLLVQQRPDLTYLGADLGDIKVNGNTIRLRHGTGGSSYSKSYKLQKYCETLPVSDLPQIILQGHFHYSGYFKNRDIYCINVPALQGYTPYAKGLGLPQELGFWEITCELDKNKIINIIPKLYNFDEKCRKLDKKK